MVAAEFAKVLERAGIANPTTRFEIVGSDQPRKPADGKHATLILRTDLEPDVAQAQLGKLKDVAGQQPRPALRADHQSSAAPSPARPEPSP